MKGGRSGLAQALELLDACSRISIYIELPRTRREIPRAKHFGSFFSRTEALKGSRGRHPIKGTVQVDRRLVLLSGSSTK